MVAKLTPTPMPTPMPKITKQNPTPMSTPTRTPKSKFLNFFRKFRNLRFWYNKTSNMGSPLTKWWYVGPTDKIWKKFRILHMKVQGRNVRWSIAAKYWGTVYLNFLFKLIKREVDVTCMLYSLGMTLGSLGVIITAYITVFIVGLVISCCHGLLKHIILGILWRKIRW